MTNANRQDELSTTPLNPHPSASTTERDASSLPASTDVVIVGAGPTGLVLGAILAKAGIPFVLVDKLAEGANTSRAVVVHARTLEVLEELGVTERMCAQGHIVPVFTVRDRDQVLTTLRFDHLPTRYPYTLMIPQNETEAILLQHLREVGGIVHRPCTVADVQQDADGVAVDVIVGDRGPFRVRARYVVGADGMHSLVRDRAGIEFTGDTYQHSFVLADLRMSWPLSDDEVTLFFSAQGMAVVAPLRDGRHRIVAVMEEAPEHPGLEDVQRLLDQRGPASPPARVHEVLWSSRFRLHHRVADRYRAGRILLVGDAAHVHSPAGGQGMNTGIQDAVVLGHALIAAITGRSDADSLEDYERTRRPIAQHIVAFTDRITRAATLQDPRARRMRNAAIRLFGAIPAVRRKLEFELAELRYR